MRSIVSKSHAWLLCGRGLVFRQAIGVALLSFMGCCSLLNEGCRNGESSDGESHPSLPIDSCRDAEWWMEEWAADAWEATTDVAMARWKEARAMAGAYYDQMSPGARAMPMRILGMKYFGEGRYEDSFAVYLEGGAIDEKPSQRILLPYVAALAEEEAWLTQELAGVGFPRSIYLQACLDYANSDYQRIVETTGQEVWDKDLKYQGVAWRVALDLIRARAYLHLGKPKEANHALVMREGTNLQPLRVAMWESVIGIEYWMLLAKLEEECGHFENAMLVAKGVVARIKVECFEDVTWLRQSRDAEKRVSRCAVAISDKGKAGL